MFPFVPSQRPSHGEGKTMSKPHDEISAPRIPQNQPLMRVRKEPTNKFNLRNSYHFEEVTSIINAVKQAVKLVNVVKIDQLI